MLTVKEHMRQRLGPPRDGGAQVARSIDRIIDAPQWTARDATIAKLLAPLAHTSMQESTRVPDMDEKQKRLGVRGARRSRITCAAHGRKFEGPLPLAAFAACA